MYTFTSIIGISLLANMGLMPINKPIEPQKAPMVIVIQKPILPTKEAIIAYIKTKDWDAPTATAIMMAESDASTTIVNWNDHHEGCDGSFSVMQVACIHFAKGQDRLDFKTNIDVAYQVYSEKDKNGKILGFRPWSTFTDGSYKKYLKS